VRAMAGHCPGAVLFYTQLDVASLAEHRKQKEGRVVFVRQGGIWLARGSQGEPLLPLNEVPMTHQGRIVFQVENALAATGAAWAAGVPLDVIRAELRSFAGDARQAPGRFNVLRKNGATVIVDYAHNASALEALVAALDQFPHRGR